MRVSCNYLVFIGLLILLMMLQCCKDHCVGCYPPPPPSAIYFRAFYKNQFGSDLLDTQIVGSYKEKEIKVISIVEKGGVQKEINLDDKGITIDYDAETRRNYLGVWIPTPAGYRGDPIATYVTLSPLDTDTITYTFTAANATPRLYPEYVYYNKQLVWELSKMKSDEYASMIIVKK